MKTLPTYTLLWRNMIPVSIGPWDSSQNCACEKENENKLILPLVSLPLSMSSHFILPVTWSCSLILSEAPTHHSLILPFSCTPCWLGSHILFMSSILLVLSTIFFWLFPSLPISIPSHSLLSCFLRTRSHFNFTGKTERWHFCLKHLHLDHLHILKENGDHFGQIRL